MQDMVKYFKLPEKLSQTMVMMLDGEVGDLNSYIRLLHKEMEKKNVQPARLVQELIVLAVRDGVYDARLRVVILKFANFIGVSLELVELHELALVDHLSNETNKEDEDVKRKRNLNKKIKRYTLIALASVGGGVIIGNKSKAFVLMIIELFSFIRFNRWVISTTVGSGSNGNHQRSSYSWFAGRRSCNWFLVWDGRSRSHWLQDEQTSRQH